MIFYLDSTHSDSFRNQKTTDYNAHYQITGYHPLVAFDGLTGGFLKAELCSGNVYASEGIAAFTRQLFEHYQSVTPVSTIMVRANSGFAKSDLYELCEEYDSLYTVRLNYNRHVYRIAEQFCTIKDNHDWGKKEVHYYNTTYQEKSCPPRSICIKSTRKANELPFKQEFIITNFSKDVSSEMIFQT